MRNTRITGDQLVLDSSTPGLVAVVLLVCAAFPLYGGTRAIFVDGMPGFGLAILTAGTLFLLPFFWGFVRRNQLVLDGEAGKVILRRRTIFGDSEDVYDLDSLDGAEVQSHRGTDGSFTHRPVLHLGDEVRPIVAAYGSGAGAERAAKAVNHWLAARTGA